MRCDCGYFYSVVPERCVICDKKHREPKKKKKGISPKSAKRKEEDEIYYAIRDKFLEENQTCQFKGCMCKATEPHHMRGKVGYADPEARAAGVKLLWDDRFFMGICRDHHKWVEEHPTEAKKEGYSLDRL